MRAAFLICVLFLTACHARSQGQGNSDSTHANVDTASLFDQLRHENPALFKLMEEDSAEHSIFVSRYENMPPEIPERRNYIDTLITHSKIRRAIIHEWTPDLLAHGTPLQLMSASVLMLGMQPSVMEQISGDTSDYWDAFQLATRTVSLGKPGASQIARLALGYYAMNHGKRVNSDSIINSMVSKSRMSSRTDAAISPRAADADWLPSYPAALAEAKRTGKNIFIDFTGYMCTNARAMDGTILSQEDVKALLDKFVLARLYMDNGTASNDSNAKMEESRFHTIAEPFYAILSPSDKVLATFPGYTRDVEAFKSFLRLERKSKRKKD